MFSCWRLTWTFLDTERSVGVLGSGVVLQLERRGVVHERLGALGHAGAAVVEIGASLRRAHDHGQLTVADGDQPARRAVGCDMWCGATRVLQQHFIFTLGGDRRITQLPLISLDAKWEKNWSH